jgi:hypothetical protein
MLVEHVYSLVGRDGEAHKGILQILRKTLKELGACGLWMDFDRGEKNVRVEDELAPSGFRLGERRSAIRDGRTTPIVRLTVAARATELAVCQKFRRLLREFKKIDDELRMTAVVPRMRVGRSSGGHVLTRRFSTGEANARLREKADRAKKMVTDEVRKSEQMSRSQPKASKTGNAKTARHAAAFYIARTFNAAERLEEKLESQRQNFENSGKSESLWEVFKFEGESEKIESKVTAIRSRAEHAQRHARAVKNQPQVKKETKGSTVDVRTALDEFYMEGEEYPGDEGHLGRRERAKTEDHGGKGHLGRRERAGTR